MRFGKYFINFWEESIACVQTSQTWMPIVSSMLLVSMRSDRCNDVGDHYRFPGNYKSDTWEFNCIFHWKRVCCAIWRECVEHGKCTICYLFFASGSECIYAPCSAHQSLCHSATVCELMQKHAPNIRNWKRLKCTVFEQFHISNMMILHIAWLELLLREFFVNHLPPLTLIYTISGETQKTDDEVYRNANTRLYFIFSFRYYFCLHIASNIYCTNWICFIHFIRTIESFRLEQEAKRLRFKVMFELWQSLNE